MSGFAACSSAPPRTAEQLNADTEIANRVQQAFSADQQLFSRHITVRVYDGVVYLGGYVWTQPEIEYAKRDARQVPGVTKVVDSMQLDRGGLSDSSVTR